MKIQPLEDRLFIRPDAPPRVTKGGLILHEDADEDQKLGTVIAAGLGRRQSDGSLSRMQAKAGDRVCFPLEHCMEYELNGEQVLIIRDDALHGLVV